MINNETRNESKIEQLIDDIEMYIDGCKYQPLSGGSKIIVEKETIDDYIRELRQKTPEEIRICQKVMKNREQILRDAKKQADDLIQDATIQTNELINEHEIMQQAYAQANEVVTLATRQAQEILDNATRDANDIRMRIHNTDVRGMLFGTKRNTDIKHPRIFRCEHFHGECFLYPFHFLNLFSGNGSDNFQFCIGIPCHKPCNKRRFDSTHTVGVRHGNALGVFDNVCSVILETWL